MSAAIAHSDVEEFRAVVARHLGLHFDDAKLDFLADVLRERIGSTKSERASSYLARIVGGARNDEIRALAEKLTVGETYFFRNPDNFRAFVEVVVPDRMRAAQQRSLRILSAGCASGEEAYTIAILLRERRPDLQSWDVRIEGIDLNAVVVEKARRARYSSWALRGTPDDLRTKYFRAHGTELVLEDVVKTAVSFEERNIVEDDPSFWQPEVFDVIFCRNVTMYFRPEVTRTAIARMARSLTPGGFLFLGHAETLRGLSQDFHLRHTHDTFYYQRRAQGELEQSLGSFPDPRSLSANETAPAALFEEAGSGSWVDAIHRASENIASLASTSIRRPGGAPAPAWDRGLAIELLREERFGDAMALVRALPPAAQADPDTRLLLAVLLTNAGEIAEAQTVCREVLERDDLSSGAHYLMALCCEHIGDREDAIEHDQAAIYLDPTFAAPHLHLGLLLKRAGAAETARRELDEALSLLKREDASRVLLFGGGFTREALVELCRAQLRALGAKE